MYFVLIAYIKDSQHIKGFTIISSISVTQKVIHKLHPNGFFKRTCVILPFVIKPIIVPAISLGASR